MTNVYMYADETGNLDYNVGNGGSRYFGIGTATWTGEPAEHLWHSERMRFGHAAAGIECPRGYHAKDDSRMTRNEVYQVIKDQAPRFDTTFLAKENAYPHVEARGQMYLYKLVLVPALKEIAQQVTQRTDSLFVAVATLGTSSRKAAFQAAIDEVCSQVRPFLRNVTVAHWDSASCWGLQVADYALWAVQRRIERGDDHYMWAVEPSLYTEFTPWGRAK